MARETGLYRPTYRDRHGALKHSSVWWARFSVRGKPYAFSTKTANAKEAARIKHERQQQADRGQVGWIDAQKVTLTDLTRLIRNEYAINKRRSARHMEHSMRAVSDFFGAESLAVDISYDRLQEFVTYRQSQGRANATICTDLAILQRAFHLAILAGRLHATPPFPFPRVSNARQGFFERAEFEAIVERLPTVLHPLMEMAYVTGWRFRSELLTREWKHVDFKEGWLRLEPGEGKTGKGRAWPLIAPLRAALEAQRAYTDEVERAKERIIQWVFHRNGKRIVSVQKPWDDARRAAGLPHRLIHDLRRTAGRNLARAGVPERIIMELCGWATRAMFDRYHIVAESDLKSGGDKLAVLLGSEVGQARKIVPLENKVPSGA